MSYATPVRGEVVVGVTDAERESVSRECARRFDALKRRLASRHITEAAAVHADPRACLQGNVSFERALPLSEILNLRRSGFRLDD